MQPLDQRQRLEIRRLQLFVCIKRFGGLRRARYVFHFDAPCVRFYCGGIFSRSLAIFLHKTRKGSLKLKDKWNVRKQP